MMAKRKGKEQRCHSKDPLSTHKLKTSSAWYFNLNKIIQSIGTGDNET